MNKADRLSGRMTGAAERKMPSSRNSEQNHQSSSDMGAFFVFGFRTQAVDDRLFLGDPSDEVGS